ncbi:MAG: FHA domain-containing protein [Lentisphaerae bacterium]|nr:FHA domain-containing protein [Lentisphaerota bacterium]
MARLVCSAGGNAGEVFGLPEGPARLGRSPEAKIRLYDKACSRLHAEIVRKGDYLAIEDLGSRHGTFVNGKRVTARQRLRIGDRIDIGRTTLKVTEGEGAVVQRPTETPLGQVVTQEISEHLLEAELEAARARMREPKTKTGFFRRLFGRDS